MEKQKKGKVEFFILVSIIFFLLLSSSVAMAQGSRIVLTSNRFVVLDDPSGWVSSVGDQWNGESTTIRWYILVLNSSGLAAPAGVSVTTYLKYPNGTVFYSATALTDSNGYANFSRNLNNLNQIATPGNVEGYWTINATATVDSQSTADSDKFIYNEYGCGKSGSGCHSSNWQSSGQAGPKNVNTEFGTGTKDSPYMMGWDAIHNQSKFGAGYPHGTGSQTIGYSECLTCHKSYNGTYIGTSSRDNFMPQYAGGLHAGKTNAACTDCHAGFVPSSTYVNMPIKTCYDCHPKKNNNLTVQAYTQSSTQGYSYLPLNPTNGNIRAHDSSDTVVCVTCHDNGHNISKPYNATGTSNTYTEYQQCTACHQAYSQHNNSVSCTVCHSQDAHVIKVFAQNSTYVTGITNPAKGNCTNCHQNATFLNALKSQPNAGNYTGRNAPQIPVPLNHSTDPLNGSLWNGAQPGYWVNTSQTSACYYCHGKTLHNGSALGNINTVKGTNNLNQNLTGSTWCANCHYGNAPNYAGNLLSPQPPEVLNKSGLVPAKSSDGTSFYNHSGALSSSYDDATCKSCHNNNLNIAATSLNFSHNMNIGSSGGADCKACHDVGGSLGGGKQVNFTAMNNTNAIHKNLNSGAVTSLSAENKKCWACHGSGSEPGSGHPSNYKTPYRCADCHVPSSGQNTNFTPNSILNVTQHYWNGTSIKTAAVTSCYDCHNKSEMMLGQNLDPDGSASVYGGANGGSNSTSHYGKKRSDYPVQGTNDYCYQCHNNPATAFPFIDNANKTIANHSTNYASSPNCADCHASQAGRIHNSTLYKPAFSLPNSTFCLNCHGAGGSAAIKNKEQHNGTLDCTQCHLNNTRSIHPVRYLQQDGINWDTTKANAVNCTNCHQSKLPGFSSAPVIPDTLKHSASLSNGTIWGTYWTSEQGSCYYCHGNTKHNNTALGQINSLTLDSNNTKNGALQTTTWCADCHYSDAANTNYLGNQWSPAPPAITVNNTGRSGWEDHTSYVAGGYKDEKCKSCHALNGAYGTTSLNYSHSLNVGVSGGVDCISCHYVGSSYNNIDTVAANASVHFGMNSNNATNAGLAAINGACWACHDTDGNVTNNPGNQIMGDIYSRPKKCDDCHLTSGAYYSQSASWGGPTVSEHYYNGSKIKAGNSNSNIESCINCHENVSEMILSNNDPDYGSFTGDSIRLTGGNMSFYHYGKPRNDLRTWDSGKSEDCSYCHQNTSTAFAIGMLNSGYNSSIQNHSQTQASPGCYNSTCHNSGWIHNNTLTKPSLNPGSTATFCQNCHTTRQTHNGTLDCSNCHINQSSSDTIHPIKFIQNTGTFDTSRAQAANCTNCHQGTGVSGFDVAPKVPEPVNHSTSLSAGQKWGNYWDNTSQITACYYCHQNEIHENNTGLLGNVSVIEGSNTFNNPDLANSTWCANCHYAGAQDYKGNLLAVSPPEITDSNLVASDGTLFFNHSGLTNFNDSNCKNCHGHAISGYSETSLNLSHSVSEGGGENCIDCHGTNYIGASPSVAQTFVNISAFNESIHQDLNITPVADVNNLDCWSCHYNKDMNRQNVKKCGDCHRKPSQWHGNADITTNLSELW